MLSHLEALEVRLIREKARLRQAKTAKEAELRMIWVAQLKREIAGERAFLIKKGVPPERLDVQKLSDDELLAELTQ
jgi:hypothetical protein